MEFDIADHDPDRATLEAKEHNDADEDRPTPITPIVMEDRKYDHRPMYAVMFVINCWLECRDSIGNQHCKCYEATPNRQSQVRQQQVKHKMWKYLLILVPFELIVNDSSRQEIAILTRESLYFMSCSQITAESAVCIAKSFS